MSKVPYDNDKHSIGPTDTTDCVRQKKKVKHNNPQDQDDLKNKETVKSLLIKVFPWDVFFRP